MLGGVAGTAIGWAIFGAISPDGVRLMVGPLGARLRRPARSPGRVGSAAPARPRSGAREGPRAGARSPGFTSFISHAGGPPASMYLLGVGLDKTTYQASTVLVFWWVNLIKLPAYVELGMLNRELVVPILILAPIAVAGVYLGVWAHRRVSDAVLLPADLRAPRRHRRQARVGRADLIRPARRASAAAPRPAPRAGPTASRQVMPSGRVIRIVQVPVSSERRPRPRRRSGAGRSTAASRRTSPRACARPGRAWRRPAASRASAVGVAASSATAMAGRTRCESVAWSLSFCSAGRAAGPAAGCRAVRSSRLVR